LRLDDPRFPRPRTLAALRAVARGGWLPVSVYVGTAATSLVSTAATRGVAATASLDGLTQTLHLDGLLAFAARNPWAAIVVAALVAVLAALIYAAQRDTWREAAIVRRREMLRLMRERSARAMTAESLRDDLRQLQVALVDGTAAVAKESSAKPSELRARPARLTEISEMLNRDLGARAMWNVLMDQQMAAWQRRQRLWSGAMGIATIVIGGLLPVVLSSTVLGG
jgi:hypothetical protein